MSPLEIKAAIAAVVLLIAAGLGFAGGVKFESGKYETLRAADLKQAAGDNAKALAQLQAHDRAAEEAVAALNAQLAKRITKTKIIRKIIHDAPKTQSCVSSPAISGLISSLQQPDSRN